MIAILEEIIESSSSAVDSVGEAISSIGSQLPTEAQPITDWVSKAWQWMNEPLPIVGFSLLAIIVFLWRFLTATSIGKKALKKLQGDFDRTKADTEKTLEEYKKENELLKKELEETLAKNQDDMEALKGALGVVCSNSRNKQVKEAYKALEEKDGNEGNQGKEAEEGKEAVDGDPNQE